MRQNFLTVSILAATFLLTVSVALATERIRIEPGASHNGALETRNSDISIGDEATINGPVVTRNGSIEAGQFVTSGSISSRNGGIRLGPDGRFESISTRNGAIRLGERSRAGRLESRNGSLMIGAGSQTSALETRNGAITIGDRSEVESGIRTRNGLVRGQSGVAVDGDINSRNGHVRFGSGSTLSGDITTRNGNIELDQTSVGRNVRSRAGDIILRGSRVDGDVRVELEQQEGSSWFWFRSNHSYSNAGNISILDGSEVTGDVVLLLPEDYDGDVPKVEIDARSSVSGKLRIDRRASLEVRGEVTGSIERI